MKRDDAVREVPENPALRRVLRHPHGPELLELLTDGLSGGDLTTLLLEVFRRRAERVTPAEVMRRYRTDRFVAPAPTAVSALRRAEDALAGALPAGVEMLTLAPVLPLAAHSAVATVDPRKVIATIRGSEVAADPTNGLALEASSRRALALADDPRSTTPVRLAASQRVTRAQHFDAPGMLAHFQILGLVTAGRDTGNRSFELRHMAEHLLFAARGLAAAGARRTEIRLTCLEDAMRPVVDRIRDELAPLPGLSVVEDPDRPAGGYYIGACFKIFAGAGDHFLEVGDGGFVTWSQLLTGNRKERLLITGLGLDHIAHHLPPPASAS